MNNKPTTTGERAMYHAIKHGKVAAVNGITDKGTGWRPVCKGVYLGSETYTTEDKAINAGKRHLADLRARVEATELLLAAENTQQVQQVAEEIAQPPAPVSRKTKRARKRAAMAGGAE